ncbi:MAG TPA: DNA gyrase subunit A, partial [Lachnospiraceae bacterium]|nr:DNA gyrase subunit A [Lachnospiraceae bacterium]
MDDKVFDQVHEVDLKKTMETSYIDYAMSVIASRALPDVRDGLKPVQRRVLYSMIELNNGPDKPHRKSARIVGDTMGKYHPHGDSSIYGALVNMAQDWSTRYPLVDGHGNFGSVDGDGAAAMRYTEARLSRISMELLADINKNTVDFIPNFDETEKEPTVLPSRYPNLLVNGTTGIAVGMATNIPPHNLREAIAAVVKLIDNQVEEDRDTTIEELMQIVKGPDFPTGGMILGTSGINEAYRTGRGKIRVRAVTEIEPMDNGKNRIVVTELPYLVNKARLIEKIAELVRDKRVTGITDLRDESDRQGMRICIELRRDANPNVILNQLYKHTQLQDTFGVIMLALVDNQPKVLNLHELLNYYLDHQKDVVTRRTKYDLNKAEERAHILQGLLIALDHIDEVISIIRGSRTTAEAKEKLMARFALSDAQAQAIVDMRLRALTGLEREKIEGEYQELMAKIAELKAILADEKKLLGVIREEILAVSAKYGDDRRTVIGYDAYDISTEDLIPETNTVITMTSLGYIKRMNSENFHAQHRGGRGIKGMETIEQDYIKELFMTTSHHYLLFLTNLGRMYRLKAYEIPEASRTSRGTAIINLLQLQPEEKISAVIPVSEFDESKYLLMATRNGIIKKTSIAEYANIRKTGIIAINLRDDDELIDVSIADNTEDAFLVTKKGQCIRFHTKHVRHTGRSSMGV